MKDGNFLIVGLGLLGGSYARALTATGYKVTAIDIDKESIVYAATEKIIIEGSVEDDAELIGNADYIILALSPLTMLRWAEKNAALIKKDTIITDVCGVKGATAVQLQNIFPEGVEFIPCHPMAGKEVGGVKNSTATLFVGANFIIVPTENNTNRGIEFAENIGRILCFAKISTLSVEKHDEMVGYLSQLTHAIAVSLMTCNNSEHLQAYTGDSFRELTRIAKINDSLWSELFMLNKENLISEITAFEEKLSEIKASLQNEDTESLRRLFKDSTKRRQEFDKSE